MRSSGRTRNENHQVSDIAQDVLIDGPLIQVSRNVIPCSSASTTIRFPLSRCASAIQMARPLESIAKTQPQLQPTWLRLSAIISWYFACRIVALLISTQKRLSLPRVRLSGKTYLFGRRVYVNSHRAGGGRNRPHPVTRHGNTGGCSERVAHFFCGLHDPLWLCRAH
jgi:hypothetical protein